MAKVTIVATQKATTAAMSIIRTKVMRSLPDVALTRMALIVPAVQGGV